MPKNVYRIGENSRRRKICGIIRNLQTSSEIEFNVTYTRTFKPCQWEKQNREMKLNLYDISPQGVN